MSEFVKACAVADVPLGKGKCVTLKDQPIAIFNVGGAFFAIGDECTHDLASLAEGGVTEECTVECPWHGAAFDLRTGKALTLPAVEPVKAYKVRMNGTNLEVEV